MGWLLLALPVSAVAVPPPVAATSCEAQPPGPPYEALAEADAGVVGTVVATDPESGGAPSGRMVLDVEASLGVDLGARIEVGFSSDVPVVVRERVGLLLTRDEGGWVADSCQRYPTDELLAAVALPAPTGRGPVAFVVGGGYGAARTVALDAGGRPLAYGATVAGRPPGPGADTEATLDTVELAACPGDRRVVEVVGAIVDNGANDPRVAVRDLTSMRVVAEFPFALLVGDPPTVPNVVAALSCRDPEGRDLVLFLTDYDPPAAGRRRLVRVHDGRQVSTILEGVVWSVLFQGERTFARVGADGTQLVSLELDSAATRPVATLPPDVQGVRVTPDGTGLVAVAGPANPATAPGVPWRIQRLRFDQPAPVATTTIPDSVGRFVSAPVLLADGGVLVAVSGLERESYALFDPELQLVRRWDDTVGVSRLHVRDGTVVGLGHDTGRWYALDLAAGRFEPVFSFEPFLPQAVLTVDGPVPEPDLPMPAGPAVYRPDRADLAEPAGTSVQRSHPAGSASSGDTGGPGLVLPAALAAATVAAAVAAGAAVRRRRSAR